MSEYSGIQCRWSQLRVAGCRSKSIVMQRCVHQRPGCRGWTPPSCGRGDSCVVFPVASGPLGPESQTVFHTGPPGPLGRVWSQSTRTPLSTRRSPRVIVLSRGVLRDAASTGISVRGRAQGVGCWTCKQKKVLRRSSGPLVRGSNPPPFRFCFVLLNGTDFCLPAMTQDCPFSPIMEGKWARQPRQKEGAWGA